MKVRLQDIVNQCNGKECWKCEYGNNMNCSMVIGGIIPSAYIDFCTIMRKIPGTGKSIIYK